MKIISKKFIKGIVDDDEILANNIPQIAFIGRSNVGKSSLINSITNSQIARTSSFPGRTQEINLFLVNNAFYLVDLPGYGFTLTSGMGREKIEELIDSYLFNSLYTQKKVILIVDANVGITDADISMLRELENHGKDFIVVANKIDKMNQSEKYKKIKEIKEIAGEHPVIEFSSKKKIGIKSLSSQIFS